MDTFNPVDHRIVAVRFLSKKEAREMDWEFSCIHGAPLALDLDDGSTILAASDPGMNRQGHLIAFAGAERTVSHVMCSDEELRRQESREELDEKRRLERLEKRREGPLEKAARKVWEGGPISADHIQLALDRQQISITFSSPPPFMALADFRGTVPSARFDGRRWLVPIQDIEAARRAVAAIDPIMAPKPKKIRRR